MERVTGIGGVFVRSSDPDALARWYRDHLGITAYSEEAGETWWQEEGPTVWAPFPADTDYFGRREQGWMINLRVRDLDAMLAQLRDAGAGEPQAPVGATASFVGCRARARAGSRSPGSRATR